MSRLKRLMGRPRRFSGWKHVGVYFHLIWEIKCTHKLDKIEIKNPVNLRNSTRLLPPVVAPVSLSCYINHIWMDFDRIWRSLCWVIWQSSRRQTHAIDFSINLVPKLAIFEKEFYQLLRQKIKTHSRRNFLKFFIYYLQSRQCAQNLARSIS